MSKKVLFVVVAVLAIVVLLVLATLHHGGASALTALTPEMSKEFGALVYVPEDVSAYTSSMHMVRQWTAAWKSNAVQTLVELPAVQQIWAQAQRHPVYMQFRKQMETNPVFVQGLPVFKDAISSEVFLCAGPEFADFIDAAAELYGTSYFSTLSGLGRRRMGRGPDPAMIAAIVELVIERGDHLRAPPVLIGFKLTKEAEAKKYIDTWVPKIGPFAAGKITKKRIAGVDCHVLEMSGETIPKEFFRSMRQGMAEAEIPEPKVEKLVAWIKSQRLTVALGIKDGYLMLSIGKDAALLEQWGKGSSLAESRALEPLRKHHKPGLLSISYGSPELVAVGSWTRKDLEDLQETVLEIIPDEPDTAKLRKRLEKDLPELVKEVAEDLPEAGGFISFSLENQGIESYTFTEISQTMLDCSAPLTILGHRGKRPIGYSAGRVAKDPGAYDSAVKWIKIAFGYFEDFVVAEMEPSDRRQYEKVMKVARPFLAAVDKTTRTNLVPSVDGVQSVLALDGHGTVSQTPGGEKLAAPVPVPRLGIAVELNDAEKFKLAIEEYVRAVKALLAAVQKEFPDVPDGLRLPPAKTTEVAGGTLYFYQLPWDMGADVFPCAFLKGRLLVLASSSKYVEEMAGTVPMPTSPVTHPDGPAGSVSGFDGKECWGTLGRITNSVFGLLQEKGAVGRGEAAQMMMVQMHLSGLWRALGAIRSYSNTVTYKDGYLINHSWLHVKDISR